MKIEGVIAEFANPAELLQAAERLRDSRYSKFDCHSPFPIHGMDEAMGEKRSPLGWIVGTVCFLGVAAGITMEWWMSAVDYPIIISGKPFFSYQAYGPPAFAVMVLSGALTSLIGMLALNGLPRFHHPVFHSNHFAKVSDDSFFISIEACDPHFDADEARQFLESIGGRGVEMLFEDER